MSHQEIRFRISLSADRWLAYYRGTVRNVQVTSLDGKRLRFPARVLQPFVGRDGVHGLFLMRYDASGRFQGIERLE